MLIGIYSEACLDMMGRLFIYSWINCSPRSRVKCSLENYPVKVELITERTHWFIVILGKYLCLNTYWRKTDIFCKMNQQKHIFSYSENIFKNLHLVAPTNTKMYVSQILLFKFTTNLFFGYSNQNIYNGCSPYYKTHYELQIMNF